jgi:hypothetical protein
LGNLAAAQTAVVTRNVNLRPDPSTNGAPIAKLNPGTQLGLLEPTETNGFFHVKTRDGTTGWAWGKNVRLQTNGPVVTAEHIGPANLYPDASMTPGLAETLSRDDLTRNYTDNCPAHKATCTYSQDHRNVSAAIHTKVYDEYNVPRSKRNGTSGEVDHFYPLCAGGSNDIKNLWYQPALNDWNGKHFGYHQKDKLEAYVCAQLKDGKLDPQEAYDRMIKDWVKFYLDEGLDGMN